MGMSPKQRKSHIQAADCYKSGKSCLLPVCQNRAVAILKKKISLLTEDQVNYRAQGGRQFGRSSLV